MIYLFFFFLDQITQGKVCIQKEYLSKNVLIIRLSSWF